MIAILYRRMPRIGERQRIRRERNSVRSNAIAEPVNDDTIAASITLSACSLSIAVQRQATRRQTTAQSP
jgi:hypothetical protein